MMMTRKQAGRTRTGKRVARIVWLGSVAAAACVGNAAGARAGTQAIYGNDSRREVGDPDVVPNAREKARSVALLASGDSLTERRDGSWQLNATSLSERFQVCRDERFAAQPSAGFCTAFLVGPDRMATAAHCLQGTGDCRNVRAVFGFAYDAPGRDPTLLGADDVYRCAAIETGAANGRTGTDWAIIRLDRPVVGRKPLELAPERRVTAGTKVAMIGHPRGLPAKVEVGASVTNPPRGRPYFNAALDVFYYHSGSPVFFNDDARVAGILVRGVGDHWYDAWSGCYRALRCRSLAECPGEEVMGIGPAAAYLARAR